MTFFDVQGAYHSDSILLRSQSHAKARVNFQVLIRTVPLWRNIGACKKRKGGDLSKSRPVFVFNIIIFIWTLLGNARISCSSFCFGYWYMLAILFLELFGDYFIAIFYLVHQPKQSRQAWCTYQLWTMNRGTCSQLAVNTASQMPLGPELQVPQEETCQADPYLPLLASNTLTPGRFSVSHMRGRFWFHCIQPFAIWRFFISLICKLLATECKLECKLTTKETLMRGNLFIARINKKKWNVKRSG